MLKRWDERCELFPTEDDYRDLEPDLPTIGVFYQRPAGIGQEIASCTTQTPNVDHKFDGAGVLEVYARLVSVVVDHEVVTELWARFAMPPIASGYLSGDAVVSAAAAVYSCSYDLLEFHFDGRWPARTAARTWSGRGSRAIRSSQTGTIAR